VASIIAYNAPIVQCMPVIKFKGKAIDLLKTDTNNPNFHPSKCTSYHFVVFGDYTVKSAYKELPVIRNLF